jgi:hypothetical protein
MQAQIAIELLEIKPEEAVQDVEEEEVSDGCLDVTVLSVLFTCRRPTLYLHLHLHLFLHSYIHSCLYI